MEHLKKRTFVEVLDSLKQQLFYFSYTNKLRLWRNRSSAIIGPQSSV